MSELVIPTLLAALIFYGVAFCYSSVGLGGGSSYTALLAVLGASTQMIPAVSLSLNILVTTIGSIVFLYRGHGRLRLIAPFMISSIPMAYLGGMLPVPKFIFYIVLIVSLSLAAWRIYVPSEIKMIPVKDSGKFALALVSGAILGLVAGIVGIGGGIYLIPLVIILGLGTEKEAAACGAIFVWANSVAGMAARVLHSDVDILSYTPLLIAVLAGGITGSFLGAGKFSPRTMQKMLGSILVVAVMFMGQRIVSLYLL